jgi:hypothetical protein
MSTTRDATILRTSLTMRSLPPSRKSSGTVVLLLLETRDSTTVSMTMFAVVKDTYDYYSVLRFTIIVDKSFGTMQS